jgi:hypothetical protein
MKVSRSVLCSLIAAAYLAGHLPFLAPSLEDIDSINFALGLREYDVSKHQPHPPGYPVYIAMGRASLAVVNAVTDFDRVHAEAVALAIWSALAGAVALCAAWFLFRGLAATARDRLAAPAAEAPAFWAVALLAVAPVFWMSGSRPMSDMPGLAIALGTQALLVASWHERRYLTLAAVLAAFGAGIRIQTLWLTGPLLLTLIMRHRFAGLGWLPSKPLAAFVAGALAWVMPMVIASGGLEAYRRALGTQAGEDFAWVDMLFANPTPRRLALSLYETFVLPWGSVLLATVVGIAAAAGLVTVMTRAPRALMVLVVAFGPYLLLHLFFQETFHARYALPIVPAVAWLAVYGLSSLGRLLPLAALPLIAFAAFVAVPGTAAYAREPHPAFRAIADMSRSAGERPGALFAHYAVRRPLQAETPAGLRFVEPPRSGEWRGPVDYWRGGGTGAVWFLADPRRTDLALIDPQSRKNVRAYRWLAGDRLELTGTRPIHVDWYRLQDPGWFAGDGWSLTPELGGLTAVAGNGVDHRPIEASVRRRHDAMVAIVGARHLGKAADGGVDFTLSIDGHQIDRWPLDPNEGLNVVRVVNLPAGALDGAGEYARLSIAASARPGGTVPPVAIRQFDIQPASGMVYAFDEGWHEAEYDNLTGLKWRWTSGRSLLRIVPAQAVRLRLRGESPLKYFDVAPRARVTAGGRVIAELRPAADFTWDVTVPAADVRKGGGLVAVETDPVYLPGQAEGTADARQLGLRLFDIAVDTVSD